MLCAALTQNRHRLKGTSAVSTTTVSSLHDRSDNGYMSEFRGRVTQEELLPGMWVSFSEAPGGVEEVNTAFI